MNLRAFGARLALAFLLSASASALAAKPTAGRPVDRAHLDALIATAEAGDSDADPKAYYANFAAALEEALRLYPAGHPEIAARREGIAAALAGQGKMDEASAIIADVLPQLERAGPNYQRALADTLSIKGFIATFKSDHSAALAAFERSIAINRELAAGKPTRALAVDISNLASINWEAGRSDNTLALNAEAIAMGRQLQPVPPDVAIWFANRVAYYQTLGRSDEAVATAREGIAFGEGYLPKGHPALSNLYANLGAILVRQGRPKTATPFLRRAFEAIEQSAGVPNQQSASMRMMFASALSDSGRHADAVAFLDQAIAVIEGQLGPESNRALQAHEVRAMELFHLDRLDEAMAEQKNLLAIRDRKLSPQHRDRMTGRANLARIALAKGDLGLAEKAMNEGVALRAAAAPPSHPDLLAERALLLLVQSRAGTIPVASLGKVADDVYAKLVANAAINSAAPLPSSARAAFQYLVEVFQKGGFVERAFEAQQWSAQTTVDIAAATSGARFAEAARPQVRKAIDARRKQVVERAAIMARIEVQLSAPKPGFDLTLANSQLSRLDASIALADHDLAAQGAELGKFSAISLPDVKTRLDHGDLFLAVTASYDRYVVTAVNQTGQIQYLTTDSARQINARISAIRATLDPEETGVPFDRKSAAALFRAIVSPRLAKELRGTRHLLVSANQDFGALPFAVLVPELQNGKFLIDRLAITRLPGAPRRNRKITTLLTPRLFAMGDTVLQAFGGNPASAALRNGRVEGLGNLPNLPEARAEMDEIAVSVGDTQPRILTGLAATRGALTDAHIEPGSVVVFATHGLVSGEYEGLHEPALVLSPSGNDDGLLTASEISRMDIPASWVVLSACNTGAGSGPDAPSLSGLAQAFMLAGADNILATHWPVRDDIARALTTGTLRHAAQGAAPAEALRQSIADLRKSSLNDANNPAQWAAFELITP